MPDKHENGDNKWPNGKPGNRRRGRVRGTRAGTRRGTLPASQDPVILQRRQMAAQLWIAGRSGRQIQQAINTWLESIGERPVSMETIYNDHDVIVKEWKKDYNESLEHTRNTHVASLLRLKRVLLDKMNRSEDPSASVVTQLQKIEMDLAKLDGSLTERTHITMDANVQQEANAKPIKDEEAAQLDDGTLDRLLVIAQAGDSPN